MQVLNFVLSNNPKPKKSKTSKIEYPVVTKTNQYPSKTVFNLYNPFESNPNPEN